MISLVPKGDHAEGVADYRPISCCNVFYKVISKILAGRLSEVMDFLLDPAQVAFIKGRSIGDNIYLTQELLRKYARKRVSPRCMIKVDLKKAFDMVDWDFLMSALVGFGFPQRYCNWIKECVTTVSYSISLNGGVYGFFSGQRGLRQGDPLSPLLFGLCIEVLSRKLKETSRLSSFHFHPMCKEVGITHLVYADDLMLFCRADTSSTQHLADCLDLFGKASGLKANPQKMQIFMAGVDARVKAQILDLLGFQEGSFPFRYLGIPLAAEKLKIANYGPLLEAITRKINAWPKHTLSYAGRLELIGTILQGMACYWLSILPIPSGVVDKIKALCRMFVWSSKCPPISWKKICLSRQEGGYGLRDLHAWNEALLCKILWNIKSKMDSLWINWVHHHYVKGAEFWAWESKASDSPLIKRLIEIRNKILRGSSGTGSANMKMLDWFAGAQDGVKSAYTFFMPRESEVPWKSMVWKPEIMPKHRFMLWMLAHGRLRTKDRMEYDPNKGCIMCHQEDETNQHLLFECPVACELWSKVKRWLEIKYNFKSFEELNSIFGRHYKGGGSIMKARHLAISSSIYYIWEARNRCRHQDIAPDVEWMFRKVQIHTYRFVDLKPP